MGSFLGHVIPGLFFTVFSIWWTTQLPRRRLLCEQKKIPYFNTATFPLPLGKFHKYPIEGIAKMVASLVGMACELFASLGYGEMKLESLGDIQHFTMYSFFLLSGLVDCFVYRGLKTFPQGMDYLALALAFCGEWLLFYHHLGGRTPLDILVHTFLLYAIGACVLTTLFELKFEGSEVATLLRCYTTFIQGTWFFQAGFILYPPSPKLKHWQDSDQDEMMLVTLMFAWHCLADVVVITVLYLVVRACYRRHCRLLDFRVEHQLLAQGWTLSSLRLKRKKHRGNLYMQVANDEHNNSNSDGDIDIAETEIR